MPLCGDIIYTKTLEWEEGGENYVCNSGQMTCEDGKATYFLAYACKVELSEENGDPITKTFETTEEKPGVVTHDTTDNTHNYDPDTPGSIVYVLNEDKTEVEKFGFGCANWLQDPNSSGNNGRYCGHVENYIDPSEYTSSVEKHVIVPPTCTSTGITIYVASVTYQGEEYGGDWYYDDDSELIHDGEGNLLPREEWGFLQYPDSCWIIVEEPMVDHDLTDWIVDEQPSCTATGKQHKDCNVCKKTIVEEDIPMTAHEPDGTWVYAPDASCDHTGLRYQLCKNCNQRAIEETIPLKDHTSVTVPGKSATCTESGLTDGSKCSVCGETLEQQKTIPPTGHKASAWKVVQEPTQTEAGLRQKTCTVCGEVLEQEEIEPLGEVCTCACHEDTLFTRLIRYLFTLLSKVFGIDIKCCEDMVPYDGNIASLT